MPVVVSSAMWSGSHLPLAQPPCQETAANDFEPFGDEPPADARGRVALPPRWDMAAPPPREGGAGAVGRLLELVLVDESVEGLAVDAGGLRRGRDVPAV